MRRASSFYKILGASLSDAVGHGSMRAAQRQRSAKAWTALLATTAGLGVAYWGLSSLAESVRVARRASAWVSVPGVILATSVERCGDGSKFEPRIRYRFDFDGSVKLGERVALDRSDCGSQRRAEALAASRPIDSKVLVLYDAAGHGGSALEAGSESRGVWAGIGALALFAAACVYSAARSAVALVRLRHG